MTISEIIFGQESLKSDYTLDYLKQNGFNTEEAELFHFLENRKNKGFYLGFGASFFTLYLITRGKRFMIPFINPNLSMPLKLGVLFAGYSLGTFIYSYNRQGANTSLANIYTNNVLIANKQAIMVHFKPFNRNFLQDEIEQMLYNDKLKIYGAKKYIYNQYVHGTDEIKHKAKYDRFNSGEHLITREMTAEINRQNQEKTINGEELVLHPFSVKKYMSVDGTKMGLKKFSLFYKKEVI